MEIHKIKKTIKNNNHHPSKSKKSKSPTPKPIKPPKPKSPTIRPSKPPVKSQKEENDGSEESESDSEKEEEKEKKEKKRKKIKKIHDKSQSPKLYKAIPVPVYTPIMQQPPTILNQYPQYPFQPPLPQQYSQHHPPQPNQFQTNSLSNSLTTSSPFYFKSF